MNTQSPIIQLAALVLISIISVVVAFNMKKHATTPKHRLALVAPLVLVVAIPTALLSIAIDPRITMFIIMCALSLMGLIWILTPTESSELYSRLRNDGGVWRWVINETPKKESFMIRGWFLFLIGLGGFVMLLTLLVQSA